MIMKMMMQMNDENEVDDHNYVDDVDNDVYDDHYVL